MKTNPLTNYAATLILSSLGLAAGLTAQAGQESYGTGFYHTEMTCTAFQKHGVILAGSAAPQLVSSGQTLFIATAPFVPNPTTKYTQLVYVRSLGFNSSVSELYQGGGYSVWLIVAQGKNRSASITTGDVHDPLSSSCVPVSAPIQITLPGSIL